MSTTLTLRAVAASAVIGALGVLTTGAAAPAQPAPARTVHISGRACPSGIRALPPAGVQRAADQALAEAAKLYPGLDTRGAEVMAADRSAFAGARGDEVVKLCGARVAKRTVVVQMLFPRMLPSASLSESVVFVGLFAHEFRVWFVAH